MSMTLIYAYWPRSASGGSPHRHRIAHPDHRQRSHRLGQLPAAGPCLRRQHDRQRRVPRLQLQPHSGLSAVASLIAIGGFVLGAFGGGRLAAAQSARTSRWLGVALGTEAVVVAAVAVLTSTGILPAQAHGSWATIAVLAAALGVQNSTVRYLGVADLTITVLTLSLTGLAADSGWGGRPARRRAASVLAMLAGAATGAGLVQASTSAVIALAAALVAIATVLLSRPRLSQSTRQRLT